MKNYKIKIEDNLPFPDETKTQQWTQAINNLTALAALLVTIDFLDEDKRIIIECIES